MRQGPERLCPRGRAQPHFFSWSIVKMTLRLTIDPAIVDLALGLVEASDITIAHSDAALTDYCQSWVARVMETEPEGGDDRRQAVRRMLRAGGFRPSGRNKPAQEYLLRAAGDALQWPVILNAVDVLNIVSLRSGLPISLVALSRAGSSLLVRYGEPGEKFVFNQSGQELDAEGLISICRYDGPQTIPMGTPVKDAQCAQVVVGDQQVLACIFAPQSVVSTEVLGHWSNELAEGLRRWCSARQVQVHMEPARW
jgi:DNA/RNA-binding domain of Phe-tRNA-synthetase-like protein